MPLRDWLPGCEPANGLTAKQERDYLHNYDETVKRLRNGPGGKEAAERFVNEENRKYQEWRRAAKRRERER